MIKLRGIQNKGRDKKKCRNYSAYYKSLTFSDENFKYTTSFPKICELVKIEDCSISNNLTQRCLFSDFRKIRVTSFMIVGPWKQLPSSILKNAFLNSKSIFLRFKPANYDQSNFSKWLKDLYYYLKYLRALKHITIKFEERLSSVADYSMRKEGKNILFKVISYSSLQTVSIIFPIHKNPVSSGGIGNRLSTLPNLTCLKLRGEFLELERICKELCDEKEKKLKPSLTQFHIQTKAFTDSKFLVKLTNNFPNIKEFKVKTGLGIFSDVEKIFPALEKLDLLMVNSENYDLILKTWHFLRVFSFSGVNKMDKDNLNKLFCQIHQSLGLEVVNLDIKILLKQPKTWEVVSKGLSKIKLLQNFSVGLITDGYIIKESVANVFEILSGNPNLSTIKIDFDHGLMDNIQKTIVFPTDVFEKLKCFHLKIPTLDLDDEFLRRLLSTMVVMRKLSDVALHLKMKHFKSIIAEELIPTFIKTLNNAYNVALILIYEDAEMIQIEKMQELFRTHLQTLKRWRIKFEQNERHRSTRSTSVKNKNCNIF